MFTKFYPMILHIAPNLLISDIQKEFNREFNFLKLEFFNKKAIAQSDYSARQLVPGTKKIGEIQHPVVEGNIEIDGKMKVHDLEVRLKDEFSLPAQVFRKSGNLWLETTMTDGWTLNQQNSHGKELSTGIENANRIEDYDLNRDADH